MLFVAQLWKYIDERLENKNGDWMYKRETWILPIEDEKNEGYAIRNSLGSVLTANLDNRGTYAFET